jgi:hypothetical protein
MSSSPGALCIAFAPALVIVSDRFGILCPACQQLRDGVARPQGNRIGAPKTGVSPHAKQSAAVAISPTSTSSKQAPARLTESGIVRPRSAITGKPLPGQDNTTRSTPSQRNRNNRQKPVKAVTTCRIQR